MNLFLRKRKEESLTHNARNLCIGLVSFLFLTMTERPLSQYLTRKKVGLIPHMALAQLFLLDYTLYLWHRLNHRSSFLWKFHRVHHADQDLTLTTGMRFHVGELFFSLFWRAGQILILGVEIKTLKLWQTLTLIEILFQHSNLRLPLRLEQYLHPFIVTPRMHGLHHSVKGDETNSNYSSGLTLWDCLHGTLHPKLEDQKIEIGLPLERAKTLSLREFFLSPFKSSNDTPDSHNHSGFRRPRFSSHSRTPEFLPHL